MREVTFQSIILTSSPALYSRTSSNSTPWPRYTLRRPPASRLLTNCPANSSRRCAWRARGRSVRL